MLDISDLFTGAVLFELHAFDMVNELSNILNDFNKKKIALWVQMRFVEVFASLLAEKIMAEGAHIYVNPDEIKWPDGTISKPVESKGKKPRKKKPNSREGVYGRIVHEYGGRKKVPSSQNKENENDVSKAVVVLSSEEEQASANVDQNKKKTRGVCLFFDFFPEI